MCVSGLICDIISHISLAMFISNRCNKNNNILLYLPGLRQLYTQYSIQNIFAELLDMVAKNNPTMRIRFSTSNPQDMKDSVLQTISQHYNICIYIHLPVQSGSSKILELMNRGHTSEWYLDRLQAIKQA